MRLALARIGLKYWTMDLSDRLNRDCQCVRVDRQKLAAALPEDGSIPPAMFADFPVFLAATEIAAMVDTVRAVRRVAGLEAFQTEALAHAPDIARNAHGPWGTLYGFDFHLTPEGPQLIEINTNAGGALLSVALASTHDPCCDQVAAATSTEGGVTNVRDVPRELVASFVREYARQRGESAPLSRVAIADRDPQSQFLYAEFLLFQRLFRDHGIDAVIADVTDLTHRDGGLWVGDLRIDLVYNRLTDFYLEDAASHALRTAYQSGDVVVTPGPRAHALMANKRHLVTLGDRGALSGLGVDDETVSTLLRHIPPAELVTAGNRGRLWADRKRYFFKPLRGYGSKAAYRGDKLTQKTWESMAATDYIAQTLVKPSERVVLVDGRLTPLKLDVRAYVDDQHVLLFASRLYQGQTTNFRTQGGGFAAVVRM